MTRSVCRQSVRVRNLMVLVVSPFLTSLAAFKWIDPVLVSLDRLIPSLLKYLKLPCGLPSNLFSSVQYSNRQSSSSYWNQNKVPLKQCLNPL
uniref:Uncharacterized protein n=1 Tax=Rhizophora mucronata TaxID=61149 RepID=A0A2P2J8G2_RHIMU